MRVFFAAVFAVLGCVLLTAEEPMFQVFGVLMLGVAVAYLPEDGEYL